MNKPLRSATRLLRAGRPHAGWVNTPVTRASTYVFDSVAAWRDTRARREQERLPSYGARGTDSVLNGIAWDAEKKRLFVTGKYWAKLYEIALADCR